MSQTWNDDTYASTHTVATDTQAIEDNFACLKSSFSGASAPSNPVAGMHFFDTTKKALKLRNNDNNAWLGILQADASHKIWVYRNTAPDGWAIDSAVTDCVLALKGGSNAYNANGGTTAGTWTQPDCTLSAANLPAHDHGAAAAHTHTLSSYGNGSGSSSPTTQASHFFNTITPDSFDIPPSWSSATIDYYRANSGGGHTHTSVGSGTAHNHGGTTYRPAAAIGTLQYLDL